MNRHVLTRTAGTLMHHTLDPPPHARRTRALRMPVVYDHSQHDTTAERRALSRIDFGGIVHAYHILPPGKVGIRRALKSEAVLICLANESPETSFDHAVLQ
jgi:hypothetical protein